MTGDRTCPWVVTRAVVEYPLQSCICARTSPRRGGRSGVAPARHATPKRAAISSLRPNFQLGVGRTISTRDGRIHHLNGPKGGWPGRHSPVRGCR